MERLCDVGESGLLARLFPVYASARTDAADDVLVGPGDDAAVVASSGSAVVTTDSMVRGLDWRDEWSSPEDVGWKIVGQNLADVAAMGARPTSLVIALAADPETSVDWCVGLATGVAAAAACHRVAVVGGDVSGAPPGVIVVTVTALGDLGGRHPVLRSGARRGDVVAVCGTLGRSGTGLELLRRGGRAPWSEGPAGTAAAVIRVHRRAPVRHLAAGPLVARLATAMIDVSDGLVRDLARLATASGVCVDLDRNALAPFAAPLAEVVGEDEAWRQVLGGGEEHALVATFASDADLDALAAGDPALRWVHIGTVREDVATAAPGAPRVTLDGADAGLPGWDHFAN
ncbi:MAG: thiamine-phosphate kinase [Dermatophilaceae bacterium]